MSFSTKMICLEKAHYPFKNYPSKKCDDVLFPGCAFPSQFPKTMSEIQRICVGAGCGVAYDCCGHPLDGYGVKGGTDKVLRSIESRLEKLGCKRVIVLCPNCWMVMKERLSIPVISIFEYLKEIGFKPKSDKKDIAGVMFTPCPDKQEHELEAYVREFEIFNNVKTLEKVPCCGLLPGIMAKGPESVQKCTNKIIEKANGEKIYTYCASCLGQFSRLGNDNCGHVLSAILGIDEIPDSKNGFKNRASRRTDRNNNPK